MTRLYLLISSFILSGALCRSQHNLQSSVGIGFGSWQRERLQTYLAMLTEQPHPLGSDRQLKLATWLHKTASDAGFEATIDAFTAVVPDPALLTSAPSLMQKLSLELQGHNVYAKLRSPGKDCVVLIGSHYDSKRLDSEDYLGANDSASSSAALLEIMQSLQKLQDKSPLSCNILAIWFDGEEATLWNWRDGENFHPAKLQDNLYGSRYLANKLEACNGKLCLPKNLGGEEIKALVLLDMIGMPQVQLTRDSASDPALLNLALKLDRTLYQSKLFARNEPKLIEDDHTPCAQRGLPVINLIDFENLATWHQSSDRLATLDLLSIEQVSHLAMSLVVEITEHGNGRE